MEPKVFVHTSYIGITGYNNHSRDFFRHLSKLIDIKIRNFTVGKNWSGYWDEAHNNEPYINDVDKKLLVKQSLWENKAERIRNDWELYPNYKNSFDHNVNLILSETDHHYFYDNYKGPKIGYNVWESTEQPNDFFEKWKTFDQMWVPSQWQAECTINQGADPNKVKVVPEGVDTSTFYPEDVDHEDYNDGRFKFILFGRWDYRKSTKEIIESFLSTFTKDEPVDLILSIDNPYSGDGCNTTEERLEKYGFNDDRLKIKHFPSREDYIKYIKKGHVFLSCARSEGWNLPLIEAMSCGTPSIYSNCSGQLEFAKNKGLPVNIIGEKPAISADYNHYNSVVGNYYEPDFEDLSRVMRDAYENYDSHKAKALKDAKVIHKNFNWDKVANIGYQVLKEFTENYNKPLEYGKISDGFKDNIDFEFVNDDQYSPFFDVEEGDVVLDLGASFGPFVWKSKKKNPSKIYAVEPLSSYHPIIENNGKGSNLTLIKKAISDTNGTLDLEWDLHKETVKTITFKDLIKQYNIDKVDFLKLDIEGAEYSIFTDENVEFLKSIPKIAGEIHLYHPHEKPLFKKFYKFLKRHNFNFKFYTYDMVEDITEALATDEKVNWASTIIFYAYHGEFKKPNSINISCIDYPKVEVLGENIEKYEVEFINGDNNKVLHRDTISNNMWTQCNIGYYVPWIIKINGEEKFRLNLENKTVRINLHSKSIGDTLAWTPYAVEFQKKHNCKVVLSTFHNHWFETLPEYQDIKFINVGGHFDSDVVYNIGWFRENEKNNWENFHAHPNQVNLIPLQQTATDILGLEFKELNYGINLGKNKKPLKQKYVVFGPQATSGCKEWTYEYWCELADKFTNKGYKVIVCSEKTFNIPNTQDINESLNTTATYLKHADAFIGLGSGLSWLNWALGKHTYMINGFAKVGHEFTNNLTKITNDLCIKCWNDPVHVFDPGDWHWCPVYKGTKMQHICQKSITSDQVFNIVKNDLEI
jgi:autotransporter strand-loop-strand O-heptosyltransferase